MQNVSGKHRFFVLGIVITAILYGSLYPFEFMNPGTDTGPFRELLNTDSFRLRRGDFLANVLFYIPLGFIGVRAIYQRISTSWRILLTLLLGALISTGCEVGQFYDAGRVTSLEDIFSNTLGTGIGALCGAFLAYTNWPWLRKIQSQPFPALLIASWVAYRLYPFVPVIDLHKYWDALKPVVLFPAFTTYDLFRYAIMWLAVGVLFETITAHSRSRYYFSFFAACVLFAKILIVGQALTLSEVLGLAVGYCLLLTLLRLTARRRALLVAIAFIVYVVLWRLEPFQFIPRDRQFGWMPFYGMLNGSLRVNIISLFEKVFCYGFLLWILSQAGLRPKTSAIAVTILVFCTSVAQIYLPDRSPEITDAVIVIIIAYLASLATFKPFNVRGVANSSGQIDQ